MRKAIAPLVLASSVLLLYFPSLSHDFVTFDDDVYVTDNPAVRDGISQRGMVWAFTATGSGNWHPLTWLSHMLDVQLFGLWAGGHHLTSVIVHAAAVAFLFLLLHRSTGVFWRSFVVALLFGVHPLHVESVAWVAERKDVLSGFFWMATMVAYVDYARRPCLSRYMLVFALLALGLLAKPMVVTLPFVLLLADFWPLGRVAIAPMAGTTKGALLRLAAEKLPLLALAVAGSAITFVVQSQGRALRMLGELSWETRLANAVYAYARYLGKMLWPRNLAAFYPHPGDGLPLWEPVLAGVFVAVITGLAMALGRRRGYFLFGWFWYLGTLVPVIGLVQAGMQSMADRYTYLPLIGIYVVVVWGAADMAIRGAHVLARPLVILGTCLVLAVLTRLSAGQIGYWRNSVALFTHAAATVPGNYVAHNNLAAALEGQGKFAEAEEHYRSAVLARPDYYWARFNLGRLLYARGALEEALVQMQEGLLRAPRDDRAQLYAGLILEGLGRNPEAAGHFARSVELNPHQPSAWSGLGRAYQHLGEVDRALDALSRALSMDPNDADARTEFAAVLMSLGRVEEAVGHLEQALALRPDHKRARLLSSEARLAAGD